MVDPNGRVEPDWLTGRPYRSLCLAYPTFLEVILPGTDTVNQDVLHGAFVSGRCKKHIHWPSGKTGQANSMRVKLGRGLWQSQGRTAERTKHVTGKRVKNESRSVETKTRTIIFGHSTSYDGIPPGG